MQKVSLEHIYVSPTKFIRQENPRQQCPFMQKYSGPVKPSISKIQPRKQTRRVRLPEQQQHIDEMIPSEI